MYPAVTPLVRAAIKRRYELIPYLYSLALNSHLTATPPQRWVGWGYETDAEVWSPELLKGETQYWYVQLFFLVLFRYQLFLQVIRSFEQILHRIRVSQGCLRASLYHSSKKYHGRG